MRNTILHKSPASLSPAPIYLTDSLIINRAGQISIHNIQRATREMELFISVANNMSHRASRDAQLLLKHWIQITTSIDQSRFPLIRNGISKPIWTNGANNSLTNTFSSLAIAALLFLSLTSTMNFARGFRGEMNSEIPAYVDYMTPFLNKFSVDIPLPAFPPFFSVPQVTWTFRCCRQWLPLSDSKEISKQKPHHQGNFCFHFEFTTDLPVLSFLQRKGY